MIVFFVTFVVFFTEAIIHYNIGNKESTTIQLPDSNSLFQIVITIAIFSFINSRIISFINYRFVK